LRLPPNIFSNTKADFPHNSREPSHHLKESASANHPKPIPHTVNLTHSPTPPAKDDSNVQAYELPPVNHDAAIKRAKIQYTGLGEMFVF